MTPSMPPPRERLQRELLGCALRGRFSTYPGGRGGRERAARNERSSDWPRGAEPPAPEPYTTRNLNSLAEPPAPAQCSYAHLSRLGGAPCPGTVRYANLK